MLINGLQVARTLTNVQHSVGIVRVANPTLSTVTLHRDTNLGWATSIHDAQLGIAVPEDSAESEDLHFETGSHLQPSEQGKQMALIQHFHHLFTEKRNPIQRTTVTEHEIDTGDDSPDHQHMYRYSSFERDIMDSHVAEMLKEDVISVVQPVVIPRGSREETK